jgi:hypothetical protein
MKIKLSSNMIIKKLKQFNMIEVQVSLGNG